MSRDDENLEEILRRAPRPEAGAPPHPAAEVAGQCACGAWITGADLYGERGEVDLGRPRRRPAARFRLYRCPLCGRIGELRVES